MNKNFDIVEKYLYDKLNLQERQEFEAKLENDEDLQVELALQQLEQEALNLKAQEELRENFKKWKQIPDLGKREAKIIQMPRLTMRWAAAAAILVTLFVGVQRWADGSYSNESLALAYTDNINDGKSRSKSITNDPKLLSEARTLMSKDNQDWNKAIEYLNQINDTNYNDQIILLKAKCYVGLKRNIQAITMFENLIDNNSSKKQDAEWDLLLIYLSENRINETNELLKSIINNPNHDYNRKAKELESKLNSFWRKIIW